MRSAFYILLIIGTLFFSLCRGVFAKEDTAIEALRAQGYSDIKIVDHSWFMVGLQGCDSSDAAIFTAKVTNPANHPAEVYVCTGLIKGGTVRSK